MITSQDDDAMMDVEFDQSHENYAPNTPSLPKLFSLVEQSLNGAIAKETGWAWKNLGSAIRIHDFVLSLRHMKYEFEEMPVQTDNTTLMPSTRNSGSPEDIYFAQVLTEVERHDDFICETMKSYLTDALESMHDVQLSMDLNREPAATPSINSKIRKVQIAIQCLAMQREPLQTFAAKHMNKSTKVPQPALAPTLETLFSSTAEHTNTAGNETKSAQLALDSTLGMGQERSQGLLPQSSIERTDTATSKVPGPRLAEQIGDRLIKSAFSNSQFLPQSDLVDLMSESNIKRELRKSGVKRNPELVKFIREDAKIVFAILSYRDLVKYVEGINIFNFTDDFLPVDQKSHQITSLRGYLKDENALNWFLTWGKEKPTTASKSFDDTDDSGDDGMTESSQIDWANITSFCDTQWLFLAKVFSRKSIFEPIHDRCPLPIIEYQEDVGVGGFSALHRGRIHPAHQIGLLTGDLIAIKQLKDEKSRAEKAYNVELNALEMVQKLDHPRIVKFVAGFEQHSRRFLMFQWVDGGNLREFWETQPWARDQETIEWAVNEIKCLADALKAWHNWDPDPTSQRFCRHGDLKPENIVRDQSGGGRGKFLIADMGLAKTHTLATPNRRTPSFGLPGTLRYQAPELNKISPQISRSVDIWSFGCILLEFIIWLLYGHEPLHKLNLSLSEQSNRFYIYVGLEFRPHPAVQHWIDHMTSTILPERSSGTSDALRDMLRLVRDRILIEDSERSNSISKALTDDHKVTDEGLPTIVASNVDETNTVVPKTSRAKIGEVCEKLAIIAGNHKSKYLYDPSFTTSLQHDSEPQSTRMRTPLHQHARNQSELLLPGQPGKSALDSGYGSGNATSASTKHPYVTPELPDTWDIYNDNQFANDVFRSFDRRDIAETLPVAAATLFGLCENCSRKDGGVLFGRGFSSFWSNIQRNSERCALCSILADTSLPDAEPTYYRNGSSLATSKNGRPIWSLVVGPGTMNAPGDIQRGFPLLPESGSSVQAELIRKWIQDCNSNHNCRKKQDFCMPTRLIDLKMKTDPNDLHLDCSDYRPDKRYVALSHRWGDPETHKSICLLNDNLEQWQRHMNLSKLPQMFQDAIKVTRELGMRYIWIDSLCIIQDSKQDWQAECQKMEDVFSSADVTLSATCSSGVKEGFIKPQTVKNFRLRHAWPLDVIGENDERVRFYLCNSIDDFKRDVEESVLSTRGWVFQERALSRRTIHFTKSQLYWECGEGIRSETLNRLFNAKSAFISDPEFPTSMASQYKGMRIEFFKEIYRRYSRLQFTYEADRSLGMAGIERRLERVFKATAWYGILNNPDDPSYLRRSLLWRSSLGLKLDAEFLEQTTNRIAINYPIDRQVPSWSWMAVKGPIQYMPAPFGGMNWNLDLGLEFGPDKTRPTGILSGLMHPLGQTNRDDDYSFDCSPRLSLSDVYCIIVGTERGTEKNLQRHYVLLIAASQLGISYARIGIAIIHRELSWVQMSTKSVEVA